MVTVHCPCESFDEVIVTTFTAGSVETLPIWILNNLSRPRSLPVVNVVALVVVILSIIPVYFAQRLSNDPLGARKYWFESPNFEKGVLVVRPAQVATMRSMPNAMPPCGGAP